MATLLGALDESTVDSVGELVTDRFTPETFGTLKKLLKNPARDSGDDIGVVIGDGDSAIGVTASIARRLYFCKERFVGICGGMLAMRKDASPAMLFPLMKRAHRPRFGSVLFYSNTCSPVTVKMKPCFGVKNAGPGTWEKIRHARLRRMPIFHRQLQPVDCARSGRCFARDDSLRMSVVARSDFSWADGLFARYLEDNDGVVGSRTTAELSWAFGDVIDSNEGMVLVAERDGVIVGYVVVCACAYDPGRWLICDAMAMRNDKATLSLLFEAAKAAVRRCSRADSVSVTGFPTWLADTVARSFPRACAAAGNGFMWGFSDHEFGERCEKSLREEKGWFFGPYDGDYFLCRM